jgi:hypothetical protein
VQPQHPAWPCNSARPLHSAAFRRAVWCSRAFGDSPRGWPGPRITAGTDRLLLVGSDCRLANSAGTVPD